MRINFLNFNPMNHILVKELFRCVLVGQQNCTNFIYIFEEYCMLFDRDTDIQIREVRGNDNIYILDMGEG